MESLYKNQFVLLVGAVIIFVIGTGITTIAPLWFDDLNKPIENVKPYTVQEQKGRDIYISEGCVNCHTQQVRPLKSEVERYGHYSLAGEYVYDRPHQLGTRRIGPDLAREGGKRPDGWHRMHFKNPEKLVPGSIMPRYTWWNKEETEAVIAYLQKLGTGIEWRSKVKLKVTDNPFRNDPKALKEGAALFEDNCSECHGEGGIGEEDVAPNLTDEKWLYAHTDKDIFKRVTLGTKNGMPSFKNDLSEEERWKVDNYVLSLHHAHNEEPEPHESAYESPAEHAKRDKHGKH